MTDLREKLGSAFSEISSLVKTKASSDGEFESELSTLQQQAHYKASELKALDKAYTNTHQQLQSNLVQVSCGGVGG